MEINGVRKIVWNEGMFLGPQHFQQWDRYQEQVQGLFTRALNPLAWGLLDLRINHQSLENGHLRIENCLALFPDRQLIAYDAAVDPPLACELEGRGGDSVEVYLGLPANRCVEGISGYPQRQHLCGWQAEYLEIDDEYDAERSREVLMARPNLVLLRDDQPRDALTTLPVARVRSQGDGSYSLVPEFIPPVARIKASPRLELLLSGMVETIGARMRMLNDRKNACGGGAGEFVQSDPLNFHLLQILSGAWGPLKHFQHHPELHPEILYRHLSAFAGSLLAFATGDIDEIPRYHHEAPNQVFPPLVALLEQLMEVQTRQRSAEMVLERENDCLWRVEGLAPEQLRGASFFLEVDHAADSPDWITDFARQVKVGARSGIEQMVASALPGVRLVHTQRPPARMSVRSGCEYFRLEARGDAWKRMVEEGTIAVFVSHPFAQASLALVRVQES
jgi:type VI secretion system protein ImpJ